MISMLAVLAQDTNTPYYSVQYGNMCLLRSAASICMAKEVFVQDVHLKHRM